MSEHLQQKTEQQEPARPLVACSGITRMVNDPRHRLSRSQKYFWLDSLLNRQPNNLPFTFVLSCECRTDLLRAAACSLVYENPLLRSTIIVENDEPLWLTDDATNDISFDTADYSGSDIDAEIDHFACRPFDLAKEHPCRFLILRHDGHYYFTILLHHIVADAHSLPILTRRFSEIYNCLLTKQPVALTESPILNYAEIEDEVYRQSPVEEDRAYWKNYVSTAGAADLTPSYPGLDISEELYNARLTLDDNLRTAVQKYCHDSHTSPFRLLAAVWAVTVMKALSVSRLFLNYAVDVRPAPLEGVIGSFLNNLVLRVQGDDPTTTFADIVEHITTDRREARPRQYLSLLDSAVHEVLRNRHSSIALNYPVARQDIFLMLDGHKSPLYRQTAMHAASGLQIDIEENLAYIIVFTSGDYPPFFAATLANAFSMVLQQAISTPDIRLVDIVLTEQNDEATPQVKPSPSYAKNPLDLFRDMVSQHGDETAVIFTDNRLSYRELDEASDIIAEQILAHATSESPFIGVYCSRQLYAIAMLIGVWKAGYAYIPLDPNYSSERLNYIIDDCSPALIITDSEDVPVNTNVLVINKLEGQRSKVCARRPTSYAYMIYTSGTTGQPKGTPITHAGLANLVAARQAYIPASHNHLELCFASISFDASVWEIFPALLTGTCVCMASDAERRDPAVLLRLLEEQEVSCACLPPAMLTYMPYRPLPHLRYLVVAGEACPKETIRRWQQTCTVINAYGPTENTVCATCHVYGPDHFMANNIGRPLDGVSCYALDEHHHLVPPGVKGELFIGGVQLTDGYLDQPEQNSQHFFSNPFCHPEEQHLQIFNRIYATGDIVYRQPDGDIIFCGRKDSQVKLHGFRIELNEVEHQLERHPSVQAAVAVIEGEGVGKHLSAYVQTIDPHIDPKSLRTALQSALPPYMVPTQIILVDRLPLTINGKVDLKALKLQASKLKTQNSKLKTPIPADAPIHKHQSSDITPRLADIWRDLLGTNADIDLDTHFFELGGDSLLIIAMAHRLQHDFSVSVNVNELYQHLSLGALADYIYRLQDTSPIQEASDSIPNVPSPTRSLSHLTLNSSPASADSIPDVPSPTRSLSLFTLNSSLNLLPIPPSLQSLLFYCMSSAEASATCHVVTTIDFDDSLSVTMLLQAWNELTRQQDAFRISFPLQDNGLPMMKISDWQPLDHIPTTDVRNHSQMVANIRQRLTHPYDLHNGPLYRLQLYCLPEGYCLAVFMHHLITDGWSVNLLHQQLRSHNSQFKTQNSKLRTHTPSPKGEVGKGLLPYSVYARWIASNDFDKASLDYWQAYLQGIDNLHIAMQTTSSYHAQTLTFDISPRSSATIQQWCADNRLTPFSFFLTSATIALSRCTQTTNFAIGYPYAGHRNTDFAQTMGYFVYPLPYRCPAPTNGALTFLDICRDVIQHVFEAEAHPASLSHIIPLLGRHILQQAESPLIQAFFNINDTPDTTIEGDHGLAQFPLTFYVQYTSDHYRCSLVYRDRTVDTATAHQLSTLWHEGLVTEDGRLAMTNIMRFVEDPPTPEGGNVDKVNGRKSQDNSQFETQNSKLKTQNSEPNVPTLGRAAELAAIVAKVMGISASEVDADTNLFTDLGITSVQILELVHQASQKNFCFTVSDVYNLRTPDLLSAILTTSPWQWFEAPHAGAPCAILVCGYTPMHPFYYEYIKLLRQHYHLLVFDSFTVYQQQNPVWDGHADTYLDYMEQVIDSETPSPKGEVGRGLLLTGHSLGAQLAMALAGRLRLNHGYDTQVLAIGANITSSDTQFSALNSIYPFPSPLLHMLQTIPTPHAATGITAVLETQPSSKAEPNGPNIPGARQQSEALIRKNLKAWLQLCPPEAIYQFDATHFELLQQQWMPRLAEILKRFAPRN